MAATEAYHQELILKMIEKYPVGTTLKKKRGSSWRGDVVGYYSTLLTPEGLAIESWNEPGSVQIYPIDALEVWDGK